MKRLIGRTGAVLAFAGLLSACGHAPEPPEVIRPVKLQRVSPGLSQVENRYAGEVRPRRESALGFRVGGKILHRPVNIGDAVKAGQLLAQLDPADLALSTASSRASVAAQQAQVDIDEADLVRSQRLMKDGYIGRADFDRQKAKAEASRAQLAALNAQLAVSANQSAYAELHADHDGTITQVLAEAGQVVAAGQPVVNLAWKGDNEIAASIPEDGIAQMRVGMPVRVSLWTQPGREFKGTVRELGSSADPATRTYPVRIAVPEVSESIRLGMTAVVVVPVLGNLSVIRLPMASLTERDGKKGVWIFDAATQVVHFRAVDVAGVTGNEVLIAGGLATDEIVVTAGAAFLKPEQKVRPLGSDARKSDSQAEGSGQVVETKDGRAQPQNAAASAQH